MKKTFRSVFNVLGFSLGFAWKNDKKYLLLKIIRLLPDVINSVLVVSLPRYIIDSLAIDGDLNKSLIFTGALVLSMLLHSIVSGLMDNGLKVKKLRLDRQLNHRLHETVTAMEYHKLESSQTLDEYSTVREFVDEVNISKVLDTVFSVFSNLWKACAYVYIMLELSWLFILVVIISLVVKTFCQNREENELYRLQVRNAPLERRIGYASRSVMDYSNAKEVRVFGLHDFITDKFKGFMSLMYKNEFAGIRHISPLKVLSTFTEALFLLTAYGSIGWSLYRGYISVGIFTQYTAAFFALSTAISSAVSAVVTLKNQDNYISSYRHFISCSAPSEETATEAIRRGDHTITLEGLSFKYPESEEYVLSNLNVSFTPGDKIAIVGRNGAGKTTLIKLLLGLYRPTEGRILLDGRDISGFSQEEYHSIFSAAFQDCSLFNYSIKENICFDRPAQTERIDEILDTLGVGDRISRQKTGLDTYITRSLNEEGSDFSGGERKKIAIARALYKDADIYVFDEPAAELSPTGERTAYDAIFSYLSEKTVFFISHRLASCKRCSRIIVLDNGSIVGNGTHNELMQENSLYAEMFSAQAAAYADDLPAGQ